jgi:dsRNA-specific ribonuclease
MYLLHIAQQTRRSIHFTRTLFNEKSASPSFNTQTVAAQFNLSPNVLTQALTHKSYKHGKVPSNERLQYVGRRSLEFFAMEANMDKAKSVQELNKALDQLFKPGYL